MLAGCHKPKAFSAKVQSVKMCVFFFVCSAKLRRRKRQEREKDKQDKIRMGPGYMKS